mgnify:CR=1 FL=1
MARPHRTARVRHTFFQRYDGGHELLGGSILNAGPLDPHACDLSDMRQAVCAKRRVTSLRWRVVLQARRAAFVLLLRSVQGVRADDNPSPQMAFRLGAPAEGGPVTAERQPAAHRVQAA